MQNCNFPLVALLNEYAEEKEKNESFLLKNERNIRNTHFNYPCYRFFTGETD